MLAKGLIFVEVELPQPYIRSVDIMNDANGEGALMVDAQKVGTNDGGRIIRVIGTDEEIENRLAQISRSILAEIETSRRPFNADEIEFLRGYLVDVEEENSHGGPVDQDKVDALLNEKIEERKKILEANPRGNVYTKPYY